MQKGASAKKLPASAADKTPVKEVQINKEKKKAIN